MIWGTMKLRLKYLGFLALFLTGSFLIVTWKAYDIFSKKYAQTYQHMQIQDLEKQAVVVNHQFENLKNILRANENTEALLKAQGIALLAHIIKEDGKWKAQWFEGQEGMRAQAKGVAQQIPFDSLSSSKKSWHFVNIKDHGNHLAYVIPVFTDDKVSYYSFFFKSDFFAKWFQGSSMAENLTVMSPQVGEIYTFGEKAIEGFDKHKGILQNKQTGLWPISKNLALISYFHPDLQLLFVKNIHLQSLVIESSAYLWALFAIIGLLVVMSLVALDLLFRGLFQRLALLTGEVRTHQKTISLQTDRFVDELSELEARLDHWLHEEEAPTAAKAPVVAAEGIVEKVAAPTESLIQELRPKTINCLGYLNRLKTQLKEESPNLHLLEKELRELRALMEPAQTPRPPQPSFNPLATAVTPESELLPSDTIQSDLDVQSLLKSIRKPKRESHESQKL